MHAHIARVPYETSGRGHRDGFVQQFVMRVTLRQFEARACAAWCSDGEHPPPRNTSTGAHTPPRRPHSLTPRHPPPLTPPRESRFLWSASHAFIPRVTRSVASQAMAPSAANPRCGLPTRGAGLADVK